MESLATFYDGHTLENKLLDQLVGAELVDSRGFFTKSKALLVSHDETSSTPTGALCFNHKRGGAVKIGPVVVDAVLRGQGIGKTLFEAADAYAKATGARKLFATTSHLNTPVNRLFEHYGYHVEATFPDQYKQGSEELVWGKFTEGHPVIETKKEVPSTVMQHIGQIAAVRIFSEINRDFITRVNSVYGTWHDDLGEDFIQGMIAGQERGLQSGLLFQQKGKVIYVAETNAGESAGMLIYAPKRG